MKIQLSKEAQNWQKKARDYADKISTADEDKLFKYLDVKTQTERHIPYFELFKEYPEISE